MSATDTNAVEVPMVCFWMGRPIAELTKEELLEVVKHLGRDIEREKDMHKSTLNMWEMCRKVAR